MISRQISQKLKNSKYPIISVTGPRQSGKTTLVKHIFSGYLYQNLEIPEVRMFAKEDPKAFFDQAKKIVIDEIQNVPDLLSYIQGIVDEDKSRQFVITGSQNLLISEKISQSLAGRTAITKLLPFSLGELKNGKLLEQDLITQIYKGFYPRIYDRKLAANRWYDNYIQTYLERDVRKIINIGDLSRFQKFMGLIAGRTGQILNLSSLASDVGVSVPTIKSWLSTLEASYIVFKLPPFHNNLNKRLIKSPKIHFYDSGLVCALLNINSPEQLRNHPLTGNIFESFVVSNFMKKACNELSKINCFYWRERTGKEIDLLFQENGKLVAVEIKLGTTISSSFAKNLLYFQGLCPDNVELELVYGGITNQKRTKYSIKSWRSL